MRIGIDLGGTKIEGIVLDDSGKERARVRVATPQDSYQATVDGVAAVVRKLMAKKPNDRYQTPKELVDTLTVLLRQMELASEVRQARGRQT